MAHITFEKQSNYIGKGNVMSNTQFSFYIRPINRTINPVGQPCPSGYLTNWDLERFQNLPRFVRDSVLALVEDESVILYEFRHHNKGKKIVDGYVITDTNGTVLETFVTGPTYKSKQAILHSIEILKKAV